MTAHRPWSRALGALVAVAFLVQLAAPAVLAAQETERWDRKLLDGLAHRIQVVLTAVCERVSTIADSRLSMRTFLKDADGRIFADFDGSVVLDCPVLDARWGEKLAGAAGTHVATNGSLAMDFCVRSVERLSERRFRVDFRADLVIVIKEAVHVVLEQAAQALGALSLSGALAKVCAFFDSLDVKALAEAVKEATLDLWVLVAGGAASDAYDVLNGTGHGSVKAILAEGLTLRSFAYHLGVFVLNSAVQAGAQLAGLGFGAAVGAALCTNVGALVGAALAVAAVTMLGNVLIEKLTQDLPLWFSFRSLQVLHGRRSRLAPGSPVDAVLLERMNRTEDELLEFLDRELLTDRFERFDAMVEKLGAVARSGDLAPYEELVEKLRDRLQSAIVQHEDWNAARKYWQLMTALGRLPAGVAQPAGS